MFDSIRRFFATDADREESIEVEATVLSEEPRSNELGFGQLLNRFGLKVAHFRTTAAPFGLGSARDTTVVYRPRRDPKHAIVIATAVCSTNDRFDRKYGTATALERFITGQRVSIPPNQRPQSDYELLEGIFG